MTLWGRFNDAGSVGFGTMDGDTITIHQGDMFAGAKARRARRFFSPT